MILDLEDILDFSFLSIALMLSMFIGKIPGTEGIWYLSGIVGAFVGVIWNFLMSSVLTWKRK